MASKTLTSYEIGSLTESQDSFILRFILLQVWVTRRVRVWWVLHLGIPLHGPRQNV